MQEFLITNQTGADFYRAIQSLPIYDYHCHLSPKEIFLDEPFTDIGEMWLAGDHYKWRLMRSYGIPEEKITGNASYREKFLAYMKAVEFAAGSPLYHWTKMELEIYFGITDIPSAANAVTIYEKANRVIREQKLSPRKLILRSGVKLIGTTDDIADDLFYHEALRKDGAFSKEVRVLPSFRADKLLLCRADGYQDYIAHLSEVVGYEVCDLPTVKRALRDRIHYFTAHGCAFSDLGIPYFPDHIASDEEANTAISAAIRGEAVSDKAFLGLLGNLIVFLAEEYRKNALVMQLHLAVRRNTNSKLFALAGPDSGGDTIGDPIPGGDLVRFLDTVEQSTGLPETVLYTLNPSMNATLASIAGAFRHVRLGAAWWFCDHKRGIREMMENIAEVGNLAVFLGMLTDSRSFLSYARHDYFRRILASMLGEWVENGEYPREQALLLLHKICCQNIEELVSSTDHF